MAGWSRFSDRASPNSTETVQDLQINETCAEDDPECKFRCLFDRILSIFLKEVSPTQLSPPPVKLGDGQCVDLFKLYWVVREKGGCDLVTARGSWGSVSVESGLGSVVGAPVKLIYMKYLEPLDRWLWKILEEKGIVCGLEMEIGEIKGLLKVGHGCVDLGPEMVEVQAIKDENVNGTLNKGCVDGDGDEVVVLEQREVNGTLKRKREKECLSGMLNWVKMVARKPGEPAIGRALEGPRRRVPEVEYQSQALVARKSLLHKRQQFSSVIRSLLQKKQKMHPSMYEDYAGAYNQSTEKLRCSQRLLFQHKRSRSGSCSETSSVPDTDSDKHPSPRVAWLEDDPDRRVLRTIGSLTAETVVGLFCKDQLQKRVPVGPLFQAEVPEWTGTASCDSGDSKWLGMQLWPPREKELNLLIEKHPIGEGRPDSCSCRLPGSVECVRFHVAEKRFQLKLELGTAFYRWRFDRMGEEVSLSWTADEERKFKAIVHQNPSSLDKCFLDEAYRIFRSKSRQSLVSYYFNVFLLRRRSYQNRLTANQINSDDESEFSFLGGGFGRDAVTAHGFKSIICSQNKQCVDLDQSADVD